MIRLGSLNCRRLAKTGDDNKHNSFIRFLRLQQLDLLAVQGTVLPSETSESRIQHQFRAYSSCWSRYCGLLSFSPYLVLSPFLVTCDGRGLFVQVSHTSSAFDPILLCILYAPAQRSPRFRFFQDVLLPIFLAPSLQSFLSHSLILGDFNYSYARRDSSYLSAPISWRDFLQGHFDNLFSPSTASADPLPTFFSSTSSSIDHIFSSISLTSFCRNPDLISVNHAWYDHSILTINLAIISRTDHGKGLWRANPALAKSSTFATTLERELTTAYESIKSLPTPQAQWDQVKAVTRDICRRFSRRTAT